MVGMGSTLAVGVPVVGCAKNLPGWEGQGSLLQWD